MNKKSAFTVTAERKGKEVSCLHLQNLLKIKSSCHRFVI